MNLGTSVRSPLDAVIARRPCSVRRTMHVDVGARAAWGSALPMIGGARDLLTGTDGSPTVLAEAQVEAAFDTERQLTELRAEPRAEWIESLVGVRAGGGFRRRLDEVVPVAEAGSLLRQVLDDMPAAMLISGYGFMRVARRQGLSPSTLTPPGVLTRMVDLCSGWRAGGVAAQSIGSGQGVPLQDCPPAPPLAGLLGSTDQVAGDGRTDAPDDLAWHQMAQLPEDFMRRRRCLDVRLGDDGTFEIWAMFRDTVGESDGAESVLHEYAVRASGSEGILSEVHAEPRVLPFPECPAAAGHVGALAGTALAELAASVPATLTGIASCTHLNDLLRAFGGLADLMGVASRYIGEASPA